MKTRIIAIANIKGGVGKTTTVLNLGYALSQQYSTLLVDMSPIASLTKSLNVNPGGRHFGEALDVMKPRTKMLNDLIIHLRPHLDLIPATRALAALEQKFAYRANSEAIIGESLSQIKNQYEFILLDCPPGIGMLGVNALYASHEVLIPIQLDAQDIGSTALFLDIMNEIESSYGQCAALLGILATMTNLRSLQEQHFLSALTKRTDLRMFTTTIPHRACVREARTRHHILVEYDPYDPVSYAYLALKQEVLTRSP
jgi:chromosome partitioning protein